jgi:hypothetical protein
MHRRPIGPSTAAIEKLKTSRIEPPAGLLLEVPTVASVADCVE